MTRASSWRPANPTTVLLLTASIAAITAARPAARRQVAPDFAKQDAQLAELAAEAAARGPVAPIPLTGPGSHVMGAVYEKYLVGATIGRSEIAAGRTADPAMIAGHPAWRAAGTIVVAYPIDCDGHPNRPTEIRFRPGVRLPAPPRTASGPLRGGEAQAVLPGVGLPDEALVVNLYNAPTFSAVVDIDYEAPVCHGGAHTVSLNLAQAPSFELATAFNGVKIPEGVTVPSPSTVRIMTFHDATGRARFSEPIEGPPELLAAALTALDSRTLSPATINGTPIPMRTMVTFVFTATGERATPTPYNPVPAPGVQTFSTSTTIATPRPAPTAPSTPVPPAPPGQTNTQLARLAIEIAEKGDPVPVPLDPAGPAVHGVVFDAFLVAAVKARAAALAGRPLDAATASPDLLREDLVAVAFPLNCGGRAIAPTDLEIAIGGTRPGPLRATGPVVTGTELAARLPGVRLPPGSVGRTFANAGWAQNIEVGVTYSEPPCGGSGQTLTLPVQWTRGRSLPRMGTAKLPNGSTLPSPTPVRLRGVVDLDGLYRFPTLAEGPEELTATAVVTASSWKFEPYRANGVPVPTSVITTLTFTVTGMPEPVDPAAPPGATSAPPGAGGSGAPPVMASATVGGRSTEDFLTPDQPGLSAATSRCEIASDAQYGLTPAGAIAVGGGAAQGPSRERRYLAVLRGPAGQGLHIVRRGSTMGPDRETILDAYVVTYEGLTAPLVLYLDEYHEGDLRAPQGFVCAAPIVVR